jgi:glyoxylase-like metal-dependent hydrolase (beta-lactamase superfamily II)
MLSYDDGEALRSIGKLEEFNASEDVLICIAHDGTLLGNVDFYPKTINDLKEKGFKELVRWEFVSDFKKDLSQRKEARL